ncbi:nucleoside triphosphate pyrophosphohydrolase [Rhodococcus sp. Rp3]|uniref:nucleoside triphosphate pyrophosphohydrolase n=1 Tax=Rhodococcus sp. Rp3 TaxID=2807635 RepID=UPI00233E7EE1|nr:nucleoside triphosphate pyrophosphohydrolase [Rhodococcus sp. Rp3]MDC3728939.1 nucleoside triphosphate pyrophosphohydrolase [Rhodococcus sp. Rp3]
MGKLVRDRIPEIIRASGRVPEARKLDASAYQAALHAKLLEEVGELREADTDEHALEEAADVFEVLNALIGCYGYSIDDVRQVAEKKRTERGGFSDRIWLD